MAIVNNVAYFGTFDNQVIALDLGRARCCGATSIPIASSRSIRRRRSSTARWCLGGRDRMVHALDARPGKARWTHMTRARIDSSPAIAGGRVYVGSNDGRFYALDLASGKVVWGTRRGAALTASPALASGRIVIGSTEGRCVSAKRPNGFPELHPNRRAVDLDALDVLQEGLHLR